MSTFARAALLLGALAFAPLLSGCPSNLCLLTVNGRCTVSTCSGRESFDNARQTCVCKASYIAAGSGCLTQAEANRYCGRASVWTPQGCTAMQCAEGYVLDLETEACVSKKAVDQAAGVATGNTLACPQSTVLVVNGGVGSCVPAEQSCARDEYWSGQACIKLPTCATGFELDPTTRQCVQIAQRSDNENERATIDVVQWSRANFGPEGGNGTSALCSPLARKPLSFGVLAGGSIRLIVSVNLGFPGGVTDNTTVIGQGLVEASGQPVSAKGAQEIQQVVDSLVSSLRAQQGKASVPSHATQVKCLIVNAAQPQSVPSTGGA